MKISKMIEVLANCQDKYGDVDVFMFFDPKREPIPVSNVVPMFAHGYFKRIEIIGGRNNEKADNL
ncbi:MAG: hypothetical protein NC548_39040 [Lachnospiraceae bacterium]|nr:hypothetical protein [Lachnospiraceae bacterium]